MLRVDACEVVRLHRNELPRRIDARQREHMKAAGRGLAFEVERWAAGDHGLREPVHVRPVRLQQTQVVTKLSRTPASRLYTKKSNCTRAYAGSTHPARAGVAGCFLMGSPD